MKFNNLNELINELNNKEHFILLIDGNCGSGKTTLAEKLGKELNANVVSIDNYYLPFSKRALNWFETSGGNIDYQRIDDEVIEPYLNLKDLSLNKYNPHKDIYEHIGLKKYTPGLIIEGSYSFIIKLSAYRIFLECCKDKQEERLIKREKEHYKDFKDRWIKKEELYYADINPKKIADLVINTSELF